MEGMEIYAELQTLTDKLANGEITAEEYTAKVDELLAAREEEFVAHAASDPEPPPAPSGESHDAVEQIRSAARRARAL